MALHNALIHRIIPLLPLGGLPAGGSLSRRPAKRCHLFVAAAVPKPPTVVWNY